jgi:hexosaminidase
MLKYVILYPLLLGLLLVQGCRSTGKTTYETDPHVTVTWELISNFTPRKDGFEAMFVLSNNSKLRLDDKNWALFFNMAPRPITPHTTSQSATIQHLNGDWYKMVPEKGFVLEPGASVEVRYLGTEGVIKETDAPTGLYFVFYGKNEQIVQVQDYTIKPFLRREQVLRNDEDQEPLPTPEYLYRENLGLSRVGEDSLLPLLPTPLRLVAGTGTFPLDNRLTIHHDKELAGEARFLSQRLEQLTGTQFRTSEAVAVAPTGIYLRTGPVDISPKNVSGTSVPGTSVPGTAVPGTAREAYRLQIGDNGISVTGASAAGVFYGIQSLLSMVPARYALRPERSIPLRSVLVEDAPRFPFRSFQLDVSRNFQTKESILRVLDLLAMYKVNHFLFYTTEDEGWRLEIDGLPELTEVGAQRRHTGSYNDPVLHPAYGSGPYASENGKFGNGYYSKEDFVEILKYARERHIKVIPVLNFPAHARAAIKAMEARYQRLMQVGKEAEANEYRLIDPDDTSEYVSAQGYKDNVVSVARESSYRFYEKVVDEIAAMYRQAGLTLDVLHAGGDEVPQGAWTRSPLAAKLLKTLPNIKDPKNLQTHFFRELMKRMEKRNLEIHAWEEAALLTEPSGRTALNPEFAGRRVVPYIWNNMFDNPDLGYRLANAGYPVVLCNVSNFYFDLAYSNDPKEPGLYWAEFVDTRKAWTFAPFEMYKTTYKGPMGKPLDTRRPPMGWQPLRPEARRNIMGLEAQLWSETIKGRDMMEYYLLPKLLGFAETAWAPERDWESEPDLATRERKILTQWNRFANTVAQRELPRLSRINGGYTYRLPPPGAMLDGGTLKANVAFPGLTIRYTTNGEEPTDKSAVYTAPVKVSGTVRLKSFDAAGRSSRTTVLPATLPAGQVLSVR